MSIPPLNTIKLDDAGLVRISPSEDEAAADAPHMLERLRPFANAAGAEIRIVADKGAPPWDQEEIVEIIRSRRWSQFIILCDDASPFADTLAMMALEQGYEVFVVFHRIGDDSAFSVSRLERAGATLMLFDRFLAECEYGAKKYDATDTD